MRSGRLRPSDAHVGDAVAVAVGDALADAEALAAADGRAEAPAVAVATGTGLGLVVGFEGLATEAPLFGMPLLVSQPEAEHRSAAAARTTQ